jgi:RNA polymerase sigma-70 factor (ECF subfamily)
MITPTTDTVDRWAIIERCRQRLHRIALRIVGSGDDADDLVQEVSLRWLTADLATVRAPEGWLVAVITRLSIDRLRRATRERTLYGDARHLGHDIASGQMVPEPDADVATRVSEAFRILRERLTPIERMAFVLREIFACDYGEIARLLDRREPACRQIVHRARERIRQHQPRPALHADDSPDLAERFASALSAGDRGAVLAALNDPDTGALRPAWGRARPFAGRLDRTVQPHAPAAFEDIAVDDVAGFIELAPSRTAAA